MASIWTPRSAGAATYSRDTAPPQTILGFRWAAIVFETKVDKMHVGDRVFQQVGDWTFWGDIAEITPTKVVIKWTAGGAFGQTSTTIHGDYSKTVIRFRDCWQFVL